MKLFFQSGALYVRNRRGARNQNTPLWQLLEAYRNGDFVNNEISGFLPLKEGKIEMVLEVVKMKVKSRLTI